MAELSIAFIVTTILSVCGIAGILLIKRPTTNKIVFILLVLLTISISAMSAMTLPSNYEFKQVIAWSWSMIALIGMVLNFAVAKQQKLAKYVLIFGTIGALISLMVL